MKWKGKRTKLFIALPLLLYGTYLLKTLMGVNILGAYSASWIFKAPLDPLLSHKSAFCNEFQTACSLRKEIRDKIQGRINREKQLIRRQA